MSAAAYKDAITTVSDDEHCSEEEAMARPRQSPLLTASDDDERLKHDTSDEEQGGRYLVERDMRSFGPTTDTLSSHENAFVGDIQEAAAAAARRQEQIGRDFLEEAEDYCPGMYQELKQSKVLQDLPVPEPLIRPWARMTQQAGDTMHQGLSSFKGLQRGSETRSVSSATSPETMSGPSVVVAVPQELVPPPPEPAVPIADAEPVNSSALIHHPAGFPIVYDQHGNLNAPPAEPSAIPNSNGQPVNGSESIAPANRGNPVVANDTLQSTNHRKYWYLLGVVVALVTIATAIAVSVVLTTSDKTEAETSSQAENNTTAPTTASNKKCFETTQDLELAVDQYLVDNGNDTLVAKTYGWPINDWCVSKISDFTKLFSWYRNPAADSFDDRIDGWDMSNAIILKEMFRGQDYSSASRFNQNLDRWNTSKVTDMYRMFQNAVSFDGDISSWDTSSVADMGVMFGAAVSFRGDLSRWKTERVGNMAYMFNNAHSFDNDISAWDVKNIQRTARMFVDAVSFSQNLCAWGPQLKDDVEVDNEEGSMFQGATKCETGSSPNLTASPPGPLCYYCQA